MIQLIGPKGSLLKRLRSSSDGDSYPGVPAWVVGPAILASISLGWVSCMLVHGWW